MNARACVCVCVCVWERERERERETGGEGGRRNHSAENARLKNTKIELLKYTYVYVCVYMSVSLTQDS